MKADATLIAVAIDAVLVSSQPTLEVTCRHFPPWGRFPDSLHLKVSSSYWGYFAKYRAGWILPGD